MLRPYLLNMVLSLLAGLICHPLSAEDTRVRVQDVFYRTDIETPTPGMQDKCRLDISCPVGEKQFATILWFHGGGLTGGKRSIPPELERSGVAVVAASYRLHPDVNAPAYIEDAAAAIAWTVKHIEEHGGSADRIVVSGHSAGGYLAAVTSFDRKYLQAFGVDADSLAGVAPISGQMITHFTIRKENGIEDTRPVIDGYAPLNHIRNNSPPILLVTGDREQELLGRYEENAYTWRMLKQLKHPDVTLHELGGYDHGQMVRPAFPLLLKFVDRVTAVDASSAK
ncbi:MAG: alpha/beta hydrolase [Planctomycetales bacterium]|jgi:acetyl esterase/lipase|nr:alpha/beta hydrolase [Planctomycetales bacterium]